MIYTNGTIYCNGYILNDQDKKIYSPTAALLSQFGWTAVSNREARINLLIRAKYSINQEFQVLRLRDENPEEFAIYNAYVEACIAQADNEILNK